MCLLLKIDERGFFLLLLNGKLCWLWWSSARLNLFDRPAAKSESGTKTGEANFNFSHTIYVQAKFSRTALAEDLKWQHPFRSNFDINYGVMICILTYELEEIY